MAVTTTFIGYEPPIPEDRDFNVFRMFPKLNREEDATNDLLRWANVLQEVIELLLADSDKFIDIFNVDRATEQFVDVLLEGLGNPFAFDLTLTQKRKLAKVLVEIYKLKGTEPGICNVLRFFLGLGACDIVEYNDDDGIWTLGESELGIDTYLGLDESKARYSFDVVVDRILTDTERRLVRDIVDYMKPAHTHNINIVEP